LGPPAFAPGPTEDAFQPPKGWRPTMAPVIGLWNRSVYETAAVASVTVLTEAHSFRHAYLNLTPTH